MSEPRMPDLTISIRASKKGTKVSKVNIYKAKGWKRNSLRGFRKFYPNGYYEQDYWEDLFRIRINDKWLNRGGYQFSFFTKLEIDNLVNDMTVIG